MSCTGFFTNCPLFRLKSFLFCMKLRTGCYLISLLYLAWGGLKFIEELSSAEYMFSYSLQKKYVSVLFSYDVMPTLTVTFSIFFIYGLYKEHLLLVFSGVSLLCFLFSLYTLIIVHSIIGNYFSGIRYISLMLSSLGSAFLGLIVVKSYYNELLLKKSNASHTLEGHRIETSEPENAQ